MDEHLEEMRNRLEDMKKNGTGTPEHIERLQDLIQQFESLDSMDAFLKPVTRHFEKLSSVPRETQTSQQKLWLLAYAYLDSKLKPGTAPAMVEAMRLIPILHETIE